MEVFLRLVWLWLGRAIAKEQCHGSGLHPIAGSFDRLSPTSGVATCRTVFINKAMADSYRTSQENDYTAYNDPAGYIKEMFNDLPETAEDSDTTHHSISKFLLKCLAKFFDGLESDSSLKIVDYGCGPTIAYSISAAPKASEIVLADYNKSNRKYLQEWVNGEPLAQDWTPHFKYVVQRLEGKSEMEAGKRETDLRRKIKAVVACDITKNEFIDTNFKVEYDIVMSFLCVENALKDLDGYKSSIAKLFSLIKEGGRLLLLSSHRESPGETFYILNGIRFQHLSLKRDFVLGTLKETGFIINQTEYLPLPKHSEGNNEGVIFIIASR